MNLEEIIHEIKHTGDEVAFRMISDEVNRLVLEDFTGLINILYRLDINEDKLRKVLRDDPGDAGDLIAKMIIERQQEKIKSRNLFNNSDSDEERW